MHILMKNFISILLVLLFTGSSFAGEFKIVAPVALLLSQDDASWGAEPIGDGDCCQ